MAKRFFSTEIFSEDWFLGMPTEYMLFWYYMLSKCDHAGIFKVNVRSFSGLIGVSVSSTIALKHFNADKQRIREISPSVWFIEDFFVFQYGDTFNLNNPLHQSIEKILNIHGIEKTSIRGLKDLKDRDKDKVKDKEIKKGGVGENKKIGSKFSDDGNFIIFEDNSKRELTVSEKIRLEKNDIQPYEIFKK